MKEHFEASAVSLALILAFVSFSLIQKSNATPLSFVNASQGLVLPPSLPNLNFTSGPKWDKGWPDEPFAVSIPNASAYAHDHCYLSFPVVGDRLGTESENNFFLIEALAQIRELKVQPTGSIPIGFDISGYDIRFKMEPVPQQPMNLDLACAALEIMYGIVKDSEVREFKALVICQGLVLGRFRTWFSNLELESAALLLSKPTRYCLPVTSASAVVKTEELKRYFGYHQDEKKRKNFCPTMSRDHAGDQPTKIWISLLARSDIPTIMSAVSTSPAVPKAIVFDLMGTCVDWYSSILPALESAPPLPALPTESLPQLAADWRAGFFKETQMRKDASQAVEDIDVTHRRVLNWLLLARGVTPAHWDDGVRNKLVGAWHEQRGWPDVASALERLKQKYFIVVLANGSTRLQLDIMKSSNLPFHTLFSSQLLGKAKPDPESYTKALELMQVAPSEAIMVAAHAYDLQAAKTVGMKTIYVQRTTEDPAEDMNQVRDEVDFFIDGTTGDEKCGFGELADILQA